MKVLRKKVGCEWDLVEIENTLEAICNEIEGGADIVHIARDVCIITKPNNIFDDSKFNTRLFGLQLFGTVLIVGVDGDEFCDLPCPDMWVTLGEKRNESQGT